MTKNTLYRTHESTASHVLKTAALTGTSLAMLMMAAPAFAQSAETVNEDLEDTVTVTGTRQVIQDSIKLKRQSTTIVDGLSAAEIGDLPALSIGEALETITGVSSHREQGGATEISIRGLGPYLGSTVINGREAANGSGDRSVNFSQFPSELFNKLEVYKTQEASMIEGGVSGQIGLTTLRPVDFGKRRVQVQAKGNWNPDNSDLNVKERDLGYRLTGSYVDSWDVNNGGSVGITIGGQINRATNPEQEARSSSGFRDCRNVVTGDPDGDNFGIDSLGDPDQNCDSSAGDLTLEVDPDTGLAPDANTPFVLTTSQRSFRQNITDDKRDSFFAAVQLQPNNTLDINADFQISNRTFTELRSDLTVDANSILNLGESGEIVPLSVLPSGALRGFTTLDGAEVSSQFAERVEEYTGGGFSADWQATDSLSLSGDFSYSKTTRRENIIQSRLRSDTDGDSGSEDVFTGIVIDEDGQQFIFRDFDVTDPDNFDVGPRVREDLNQFRNNDILGLRGDATWENDIGFVNAIRGGFRYSELGYDAVPRVRRETDGNPISVGDGEQASADCRRDVFPENGFLSSVTDGNVITNIDSDGNIIASGTGASWVSFDPICLAESLLGRAASIPDADDVFLSSGELGTGQNPLQIVDVKEETIAAYIQADYATELGSTPIRGNFGVRLVNTDLTSKGFRGALELDRDADGVITGIGVDNGDLTQISDTNSYTELLPSFNLVADVRDDILVRGAVFRALSRPDPSDLGVGRSFSSNIDNENGSTDVADVLAQVSGFGNPQLDPLMSWNFDTAIEWYPNEDSILAVGLYHKSFQGGFRNVGQLETFSIDGQDLNAVVTTQQTSDDNNSISGVEITASHGFTYLPGLWEGLGFKLSYNYADSNFEFEDAELGAATQITGDGTEVERVGIVAPANVPGLSKHVLSAQVYWGVGDFDIQGLYKYRSDYFQQFISTPGNLRYIGDVGVYEARASYKLNDNLKLSVEAINLFNEPKTQYNPTKDSFAEVNVYGPRVFFGVTGKF